ncbi:DUF1194 domain-containing protein [Falsiroseomonas selenitidurans]|uniref:DUF1194 domain-containing protein n=1 Tax=Falsiroseomonas selenitidurans TaxID=2716335 RepID=A0ABX1E091_9PROT|nr:DUF1194 domain-containing protein [Falsiroseomonas selenitidurans]NKC30572.1 DUF1194 domain-containing protein [Falsiroseomonas selenitidurans]
MILPRRALLAAPALVAGRAAAQGAAVDLLLVLAVDASGSIDVDEFALQRDGLAEAIAHPAVLSAIRSRPLGAIGVAMVEWGSPGGAATVVDWMRVADAEGARAAGAAMRDAPRSRQSYNAIGDAILHATALIAAAPWAAEARTIDLSGDGPDIRSLVPAAEARDLAVAQGIVVNALAIEASSAWSGGRLEAAYRRDVIGGAGAFVMVAEDRRDFARALRAKLVRELALHPAAAGAAHAAGIPAPAADSTALAAPSQPRAIPPRS